jgi:hypothetical protein
LWVIEGLDIARLRVVPLRVVVGVLCLVGIALAIIVPDLVPPTPLVGAAVALAALLLGLAVAVAVDAADLTVRGPRHVRAAGGELVAILPSEPDPQGAVPLAEAVLEAREEDGQRLLLGLAAAGRDARRCSAWTDALAVALARTGASVLRVDLANGRSERAGLVEVVREGRKLPSVVTFDPDLRLARIGAGHDHAGALEALPTLPTRLPRDLDVLLVALPTAASRQVVAATAALDHVLVVAERDSTSRVDLIAGLDALEAAGIAAQVMLLDDRTAARLTPQVRAEVAAQADEEEAEPLAADGAADEPDEPDEPDDAQLAADGAAVEPDEPEDAPSAEAAVAVVGADEPPAAAAADLAEATGDDERHDLDEPDAPGHDLDEPDAPGHDVDEPDASGHDEVPEASDHDEVPDAPGHDVDEPDASDHEVADAAVDEPGADQAISALHRVRSGSREHRTDRGNDGPVDTGVQLLPGAGPTPARPSPDLEQPSVAPRDVDVMLGAAAASAAAHADASDEPLPPIARRSERTVAPESAADRPASPPSAAAETRQLSPVTGPSSTPDPVDVTEELAPIDPGASPGSRPDTDEPERDDVRTTAQLAILLDDLQARRDRS